MFKKTRINSDAKFFLDGVATRLYVYEDKVEIEHHGLLGFLIQGLSGKKSIPMSSIRSIQFREGGTVISGFIQFGLSGGVEKQGGVFNAAGDENSVVFTQDKNEDALKIKSFIEDKIQESLVPTASSNQISIANEIVKFKELMDAGVISEDEFLQQKARLLK